MFMVIQVLAIVIAVVAVIDGIHYLLAG